MVGQEGASGTSEESPQGTSDASSDVQLTNDTRSTIALEVLDERHPASSPCQQLGAIRRGRSSSVGDSDIGREDQNKRASLNSEASGDYFYDEPTLAPVRTGAQAIASSAGLDTIQESGQESSPTHPLLADMAQLALHGPEAVVGVMGIGYGLAASTPGVV